MVGGGLYERRFVWEKEYGERREDGGSVERERGKTLRERERAGLPCFCLLAKQPQCRSELVRVDYVEIHFLQIITPSTQPWSCIRVVILPSQMLVSVPVPPSGKGD